MKLKFVSGHIQVASLRFIKALEGLKITLTISKKVLQIPTGLFPSITSLLGSNVMSRPQMVPRYGKS